MKLPHKFGKYVLVGKIAQGGMAEIYRAKYLGESGFVKDVAVKRILPVWSDNKEFVAMLCDEAKALVHLQHQNIVQAYELGKDGETFYISMEYVEGVDLRRLFQKIRNGIPLKFTCFIISEILKALDFAHNRKDKHGSPLGIIHRDISPQNVLVSFNGEVKVADFGIAKGTHRSFETAVAQVKGKYAYMSPEQATGGELDARTDIYAVGVIFYEFLTGKRLYEASNDLLTIEQVKKSILPEDFDSNVPAGIRQIARRSLQRVAGKRYQSAAEFLDELNSFIITNNLVVNSVDFSTFLKDIFHKEYHAAQAEIPIEGVEEEKRPQTKILSMIPKTKSENRASAIKKIGLYGMAVALPLVLRISPPALAPLPTIIVPPEESYGTLNVQARPWGYVYIPGQMSKRETPVRGAKLKPGNYEVKVYYEPENKWVQRRLTVASNSNTTCLANFSGDSSLACKPSK